MKKLFYLNQVFARKELKDSNYLDFKRKFESILNISNIDKWSNKKIMKYVEPENFNNYIAYIFELFDSWLKDNERYTKGFLSELEYVIRKLNLEKYLNQEETNYIENIFNVVFAKTRVLKDIVINFKVKSSNLEKIYFKYDVNVVVQKFRDFKFANLFEYSSIYLTTNRILIADAHDYLSIPFDEITNISLHNEYLKISANKRDFLIYSFDVFLIYVSIERMGRTIKKFL